MCTLTDGKWHPEGNIKPYGALLFPQLTAQDLKDKAMDDDDVQDYVRPWKGLTEDEVFALSNTMPYADRFEFAKAVEAKLKEKNT
jgi:hypothetical protein